MRIEERCTLLPVVPFLFSTGGFFGPLVGAANVAEVDFGVCLDARQENKKASLQRMRYSHENGPPMGPSPVARAVRFGKPNRPSTVLQAVPIGMGMLIGI